MISYTLNNGNSIPSLGLGTYKNNQQNDVTETIKTALKNDYSLIDTAEIYGNETEIGNAISTCKSDRNKFFLTSKVWNTKQGYDNTLRSFERSLKNLKTDYLDLYLIHWPFDENFTGTWKALEHLYEQKVAKNIGVCNFHQHHLEKLFAAANIIPAVNQIELHPYLQQNELRSFCKKHNISVQAWAPIAKGRVTNDTVLSKIGKKHNKNAVQVTLRWLFQNQIISIPKTTKTNRIIENIDIFNFKLSDDDMQQITKLDKDMRVGPDPDFFVF